MGLLCSRSRSQWWFEMSVNVSVDNIFWITAHFVTKFGMVMQHHQPESYGHFVVVAIFKVKVTARAHIIKIWLFLLYNLNCWFLGNLGLIIHHQKPVCPVKKNGLLHSGSRSQQRVKKCNFFQMISSKNHQTFCFQTWYCDSSLWVRVSCKKIYLLFSRSGAWTYAVLQAQIGCLQFRSFPLSTLTCITNNYFANTEKLSAFKNCYLQRESLQIQYDCRHCI